ncbi:MAG: YDG domain-containing protein [Firmicutes bacterium]|nr:YDG domain-containing protein [Bacillota bacterium]
MNGFDSEATLTVTLANISGLTLYDKTVTYNGLGHSLTVACLTQQQTCDCVSFFTQHGIEVGEIIYEYLVGENFVLMPDLGLKDAFTSYTIRATIKADNYNDLRITRLLTIEKATMLDFTTSAGFTLTDESVEYGAKNYYLIPVPNAGTPESLSESNLTLLEISTTEKNVIDIATVSYTTATGIFNGAYDAGIYTITALIRHANYEDIILTATLIITQKEIAVIWNNGVTPIEYTFNGFVQHIPVAIVAGSLFAPDSGATLSVTYLGTSDHISGETAFFNAGEYNVFVAISSANYIITNGTEEARMFPASPITGVDIFFVSNTQTYNATNHIVGASLTNAVPSGATVPTSIVLFGTTFSIIYRYIAVDFSVNELSANAWDNYDSLPEFTGMINAGKYFVRAVILGNNNVEIWADIAVLTVEKRVLSFAWNGGGNAWEREYDATSEINPSQFSVNNSVTTIAVTANYNNKHAGFGKAITFLVDGEETHSNYAWVNRNDGSITQKDISNLVNIVSLSKVYDGTNIFNTTNFTVADGAVIAGDTVIFSATYNTKNVEIAPYEYIITFNLGGADGGNYRINSLNGTELITPLSVTVQWANTNVSYNGTDQSGNVTARFALVGDDQSIYGGAFYPLSVNIYSPRQSTNLSAFRNAGEYSARAFFEDIPAGEDISRNYSISGFDNYTLEITALDWDLLWLGVANEYIYRNTDYLSGINYTIGLVGEDISATITLVLAKLVGEDFIEITNEGDKAIKDAGTYRLSVDIPYEVLRNYVQNTEGFVEITVGRATITNIQFNNGGSTVILPLYRGEEHFFYVNCNGTGCTDLTHNHTCNQAGCQSTAHFHSNTYSSVFVDPESIGFIWASGTMQISYSGGETGAHGANRIRNVRTDSFGNAIAYEITATVSDSRGNYHQWNETITVFIDRGYAEYNASPHYDAPLISFNCLFECNDNCLACTKDYNGFNRQITAFNDDSKTVVGYTDGTYANTIIWVYYSSDFTTVAPPAWDLNNEFPPSGWARLGIADAHIKNAGKYFLITRIAGTNNYHAWDSGIITVIINKVTVEVEWVFNGGSFTDEYGISVIEFNGQNQLSGIVASFQGVGADGLVTLNRTVHAQTLGYAQNGGLPGEFRLAGNYNAEAFVFGGDLDKNYNIIGAEKLGIIIKKAVISEIEWTPLRTLNGNPTSIEYCGHTGECPTPTQCNREFSFVYDTAVYSVSASAESLNGIAISFNYLNDQMISSGDAGNFLPQVSSILDKPCTCSPVLARDCVCNDAYGSTFAFNYSLSAVLGELQKQWEVRKRQISFGFSSEQIISKEYDGSASFDIGNQQASSSIVGGLFRVDITTWITGSGNNAPIVWWYSNIMPADSGLAFCCCMNIGFVIQRVAANHVNVWADKVQITLQLIDLLHKNYYVLNYGNTGASVGPERVDITDIDCEITERIVTVILAGDGSAPYTGNPFEYVFNKDNPVSESSDSLVIRAIEQMTGNGISEIPLARGNYLLGSVGFEGCEWNCPCTCTHNDKSCPVCNTHWVSGDQVVNASSYHFSNFVWDSSFVWGNTVGAYVFQGRFTTSDSFVHPETGYGAENYIVTVILPGESTDFSIIPREFKISYTNDLQNAFATKEALSAGGVELVKIDNMTIEEFNALMIKDGLRNAQNEFIPASFGISNGWLNKCILDIGTCTPPCNHYSDYAIIGNNNGAPELFAFITDLRNNNNYKFNQPIVQITYLQIKNAENYEFYVSNAKDVMMLASDIAGLLRAYTQFDLGIPPTYFQTADIDMVENGIMNIFTTIPVFEGVYNGQGKTINNLFIVGNAGGNAGMFGILRGTVMNLNLLNVSVSGFRSFVAVDNIGAIAGVVEFGTIKNVNVHGAIYALIPKFVGGIAGYAEGAVIENVQAVITIHIPYANSDTYIGGIVGSFEVIEKIVGELVNDYEKPLTDEGGNPLFDEDSNPLFEQKIVFKSVFHGSLWNLTSFVTIFVNGEVAEESNANPVAGNLIGITFEDIPYFYLSGSVFINGVQQANTIPNAKTYEEFLNFTGGAVCRTYSTCAVCGSGGSCQKFYSCNVTCTVCDNADSCKTVNNCKFLTALICSECGLEQTCEEECTMIEIITDICSDCGTMATCRKVCLMACTICGGLNDDCKWLLCDIIISCSLCGEEKTCLVNTCNSMFVACPNFVIGEICADADCGCHYSCTTCGTANACWVNACNASKRTCAVCGEGGLCYEETCEFVVLCVVCGTSGTCLWDLSFIDIVRDYMLKSYYFEDRLKDANGNFAKAGFNAGTSENAFRYSAYPQEILKVIYWFAEFERLSGYIHDPRGIA